MNPTYCSIRRNVLFGILWIFGWIPALILLIVEKDVFDREDKRELISIIICSGAAAVLSFTFVVPLYAVVCSIIACVYAFQGKSFKVPGAYHIAAAILK